MVEKGVLCVGSKTVINLQILILTTVVVAYIYTMKTTFDFNFDLYQAGSMNTHKHRSQEKQSIKKLLLLHANNYNSKKAC